VRALSKRYGYSMKPRLDEKALKDNLGENKTIFVSATGDMFGEWVKEKWILKVLEVCRKYPKNTYLFQSKNPLRFLKFKDYYPRDNIFGTTIETNRSHLIGDCSKAPLPEVRAKAMKILSDYCEKTMITIEPVIDFDLKEFVELIKKCKPKWVNIGADSKGHNLPEPSKEKVEALTKELKKFTEVRLKDNLKRIWRGG